MQRLSMDEDQSEYSNRDDDFRDARKQPMLGGRHDFTGRLGNRCCCGGLDCADEDDVAEGTECDLH